LRYWPDDRGARRFRRRSAAPYVLILPFMLSYLVFDTFAVVGSFGLSFTDYRGYGAATFIGLENYKTLFTDATLRQALGHTMVIWLLTVPLLSFGSLFVGWILESRFVRPLRSFLRTTFFLPVLPSLAVVSIIFLLMMDPKYGLIGQLFDGLGLTPVNILVDPHVAVPLISAIVLWKNFGYMVVVQLAALQAFPAQVREAALVDGASGWTFFWRVLVPICRPSISFVAVITSFGVINQFDESYFLYETTGGPDRSGLVLGTYLYRVGFVDFRLGYASAVAYGMAMLMFVVALLQLRWSRER
jgi:ABC-type sugar transport system permease subunit